jgi:hypothetical protein
MEATSEARAPRSANSRMVAVPMTPAAPVTTATRHRGEFDRAYQVFPPLLRLFRILATVTAP